MEYKITKEQILDGAKKCPTAEGVLKAMFPDAFEDEWEEVPLSKFILEGVCGEGILVQFQEKIRDLYPLPFKIEINPKSEFNKDFKVESGHIYFRRRK